DVVVAAGQVGMLLKEGRVVEPLREGTGQRQWDREGEALLERAAGPGVGVRAPERALEQVRGVDQEDHAGGEGERRARGPERITWGRPPSRPPRRNGACD